MDSPQAIGYGVTISAPHMHAHALEMLKDHLYEGAKALDVGSGIFNYRISVERLNSHPNFQKSCTLTPEESPFSWCSASQYPSPRWRNPLHTSRKSSPKFQMISFKFYSTQLLICILLLNHNSLYC